MRSTLMIWTAALVLGIPPMTATAQTSSRGQAASPGQARPAASSSRLPQPPSGGQPTGVAASGPQTQGQRDAEEQAKRSTQICKGC